MSEIKLYLNTLRQKGYLAYEYNPFHNYQTDVDLYLYDDKYLIPENCALNTKNGEILKHYSIQNGIKKWIDKNGRIINENVVEAGSILCELYASAGSLIDLDTELLNFDINHPVDIQVQPSYDGSVNLILNDNKNIPRLINSRFSVREKNTYEIVDRIGENDTNIYNSKTFDKDTSLYFQYESNPIINYAGFVNGILPVGSYCFYFTYCDADDNESDFIAESGIIPVFLGGDREPYSMNGGIKNENSNKGIKLKLTNVDKSYNYFKIYYVRNFADYQQNKVIECKKIYRKYPINSGLINLQITGNEDAEDIDPNILNLTKFNPKHVLAQAQCKNILFFGNVVKNSDNYKELQDCALRIIPELVVEKGMNIPSYDYASGGKSGYYDSTNVYNKVGYFNQEYYRFGIVFIYKNGTLSNVYNTLGVELFGNNNIRYTGNLFQEEGIFKVRQYIEIDDNGWIKNSNKYYSGLESQHTYILNSRGVCRFNYKGEIDDSTIFGVKFNINEEIQNYLKEDLGIRGFFFVRQKCVPTILAQCYLLPMDEVLETPVLKYKKGDETIYQTECFVSNKSSSERLVTNDYDSRLYKYQHNEDDIETSLSSNAYAAICPDFALNQPYYNQIFNGNKFTLKRITNNDELERIGSTRFYKESNNKTYIEGDLYSDVTVCTVTEDVPQVALFNKVYKLDVGQQEEVFRFGYAEIDKSTYSSGNEDFDAVNEATNIVRGKYSPYLAIHSSTKLKTGQLYNIYQSNPEFNLKQEYQNRMDSSEPFYAISDRYNFEAISEELTCWRGDCFINLYTHRLNRNFNDSSLPNNDQIIDKKTWKDNYRVENQSDWKDISRSDINAVQMGSWITLKLRSSVNFALRSIDHSFVSEEALMGAPRSYYPMSQMTWRGRNKLPDSCLYNDAFRTSLGYKCYFTLQDINYIKNSFSNRIQYSAVSIQDSFKNNYRDSLSTQFRDYSQEYGSIQKLVENNGNLLVVFEHGIGIATVNERVLAGEGEGGPVFINTQNVLPEELIIISDSYGTQWPDSVIKSEAGFIYGIDTIAKKIWRVKEQQVELLSDFKVNKFLIENISLEEKELYPTIGLKNVKTHYNNNKKDVIFTFYDDIYKDEEKVWSLCYNELLEQFVTFYSWIPSYSENIDTKFFTFNRDTSKCLSLLYTSNYNIPDNYGVLLDSPIISIDYTTLVANGDTSYQDISEVVWGEPDVEWNNLSESEWVRRYDNSYIISNIKGIEIFYRDKGASNVTVKYIQNDSITTSKIKENLSFIPNVSFELLRDRWGNYKLFDIKVVENEHDIVLQDDSTISINGYHLVPKGEDSEEILQNISNIQNYFRYNKVMYLYIQPKIDEELDSNGLTSSINFKPEIVAFTLKDILENPALTNEQKEHLYLTTDFYLHGQAGIFNVKEDLYPTHWYGEYHPFEFEFVVNDKIGQQKIFTNLEIISNKAEPESFHFEIEGDNYDFSQDKRAIYFRQEATKNLYQNLGSDIIYNRYYTDVTAREYTHEQYYRKISDLGFNGYENKYKTFDRAYPIQDSGLVQQKKSTIFPLYYERIDTYNDVYHKYHLMHDSDATYDFQNLSGSEIAWNRDLNQFNIITHIKNSPIDLVGRLRGNSRYKEGKWSVQIPSIIFMQKNEDNWPQYDGSNQTHPLNYDGPLKDTTGFTIPPIVINSQYVPNDLSKVSLGIEDLPNIYTGRLNYPDAEVNYQLDPSTYVRIEDWTQRKETKIRDKWIKIRVRYSGKNLAIIHSLITLYNISYS